MPDLFSTSLDTTPVKALVLHGPKDLRLETHHLPPPGPHDLQIAIRATGLCGSDMKYYTSCANGPLFMRSPLILGHESSGLVVNVGSAVAHTGTFSIGDRVALEVGVPCSSALCSDCSTGRYNLCSEMRFRSSAKSFPHVMGTLQERVNHPARWCYKLPTGMSYEVGALVEPLGVALHAGRRAGGVVRGQDVMVFGAGSVGIACCFVAKRYGAGRVVVTDLDAGRVAFAVSQGYADRGVVVPRVGRKAHGGVESIEDALEGARRIAGKVMGNEGQFDLVFECTGQEVCVQAGIYVTRSGGKVMMVGMGTPIQTLPLSEAALREVDLCGVFRYADCYGEGVSIVGGLAGIVTHRFRGLERGKEAFEMARKTMDGEGRLVLKVMMLFD